MKLKLKKYQQGGMPVNNFNERDYFANNRKFAEGGSTSVSDTKPGFYTEQGGDKSGMRYYLNERNERIYDSMPEYTAEQKAAGKEVKPGTDYNALLEKMKQREKAKPQLRTSTTTSNQRTLDQMRSDANEKGNLDISVSNTETAPTQQEINNARSISDEAVPSQSAWKNSTSRQIYRTAIETGTLGSGLTKNPVVALTTAAASLGVTVNDIIDNPSQYKEALSQFGGDLFNIATSYAIGKVYRGEVKLPKLKGKLNLKSYKTPTLKVKPISSETKSVKQASKEFGKEMSSGPYAPKTTVHGSAENPVNINKVRDAVRAATPKTPKPGSAEDITNKLNDAVNKRGATLKPKSQNTMKPKLKTTKEK